MVAFISLAMALAKRVLPVPGGPWKMKPRGISLRRSSSLMPGMRPAANATMRCSSPLTRS